jgi:hypothetical protein
MLTSLLPLEGFHDFSKIKFLQEVLDKNLSPSSHMSLILSGYPKKFINSYPPQVSHIIM